MVHLAKQDLSFFHSCSQLGGPFANTRIQFLVQPLQGLVSFSAVRDIDAGTDVSGERAVGRKAGRSLVVDPTGLPPVDGRSHLEAPRRIIEQVRPADVVFGGFSLLL